MPPASGWGARNCCTPNGTEVTRITSSSSAAPAASVARPSASVSVANRPPRSAGISTPRIRAGTRRAAATGRSSGSSTRKRTASDGARASRTDTPSVGQSSGIGRSARILSRPERPEEHGPPEPRDPRVVVGKNHLESTLAVGPLGPQHGRRSDDRAGVSNEVHHGRRALGQHDLGPGRRFPVHADDRPGQDYALRPRRLGQQHQQHRQHRHEFAPDLARLVGLLGRFTPRRQLTRSAAQRSSEGRPIQEPSGRGLYGPSRTKKGTTSPKPTNFGLVLAGPKKWYPPRPLLTCPDQPMAVDRSDPVLRLGRGFHVYDAER